MNYTIRLTPTERERSIRFAPHVEQYIFQLKPFSNPSGCPVFFCFNRDGKEECWEMTTVVSKKIAVKNGEEVEEVFFKVKCDEKEWKEGDVVLNIITHILETMPEDVFYV